MNEEGLKSWTTFIVFVTLWLTFLAWLWKLVIL